FASRAGELVVELGVLEMLELQRQRLLEDHDVHTLTELRTQQRLTQRDTALGAGDCRDQQSFAYDEEQCVLSQSGAMQLIGPNRSDDGIDDERADVRDCRRQRTCNQREDRERNRERATGRPHQLQRAVAVCEDAEKAALEAGLAENRLALSGIQGRRATDITAAECGGV